MSLKRTSMAHAVLNCPLPHDLDIASCHKLLHAAIQSAVTSCPLVESLDMSNCSCGSDETFREIPLGCAYLYIMNASYCPNISLEVDNVDGSQDAILNTLRGNGNVLFPVDTAGRRLELLLILKQVETLEKWIVETKLSTMRPNTMNNYGVVLDDFGRLRSPYLKK
ncbi:hypothetical protein L2E82_42481 [Cichorium intybus]|uniref:Uncharacterized protein n=1 Tax=Cichorium intybus TaxID=13427 RepID=A0ACB8ZLW6_CICIN|nr:hypothetical protein L2E82_42481 [Cichorium intybus]